MADHSVELRGLRTVTMGGGKNGRVELTAEDVAAFAVLPLSVGGMVEKYVQLRQGGWGGGSSGSGSGSGSGAMGSNQLPFDVSQSPAAAKCTAARELLSRMQRDVQEYNRSTSGDAGRKAGLKMLGPEEVNSMTSPVVPATDRVATARSVNRLFTMVEVSLRGVV